MHTLGECSVFNSRGVLDVRGTLAFCASVWQISYRAMV